MDKFDEIVSELKKLDKTKQKKLLSELSKDKKTMEQLSGILQNPDIQKKLKDILG